MYNILVRYKDLEPENLLANNYEELKKVIELAPIVEYEILEVEKCNYGLAKDFISFAKGTLKPKGLVLGSDKYQIFREDCKKREE